MPAAPLHPPCPGRILGLDVSLRCTGYGVVDPDGRGGFRAVDCGVIRTTAKHPLSECLRRLAGGIRELIDAYHPEVAAIEGGFFFKNARTAMVLGAARGVAIAWLAERDVPLYEYAPMRAKQAVCGFGNASKEQVAQIVATRLGLTAAQTADDATDALAIALCHGQAASGAALRLAKRL
ncbi:MAG: crossover junction endodeoxyribonuclease RuvC [Lentisphaeria bacterium]